MVSIGRTPPDFPGKEGASVAVSSVITQTHKRDDHPKDGTLFSEIIGKARPPACSVSVADIQQEEHIDFHCKSLDGYFMEKASFSILQKLGIDKKAT